MNHVTPMGSGFSVVKQEKNTNHVRMGDDWGLERQLGS